MSGALPDGVCGTLQILPLFVMDAVLPGKKMALNIFEPRYRLMTRRVMEGNRMFGMVSHPHPSPPAALPARVELLLLQRIQPALAGAALA